MVTLLIDEVYIAERVEYSNGSFIGITENGTPGKTVLGFMIQSIFCSYKDVVCLIPISTLDTSTLYFWFTKVMEALKNLFHVVAVCTDNHICNRWVKFEITYLICYLFPYRFMLIHFLILNSCLN